jgi:hypothetical protein
MNAMRLSHYQIAPSNLASEKAWLVYDARQKWLVATSLRRPQALTLAHTLNVADLSMPARRFGDPWDDGYGPS